MTIEVFPAVGRWDHFAALLETAGRSGGKRRWLVRRRLRVDFTG